MYRVADPAAGVMVDRTAEVPSIRRTLGGLHRYRHLLRNLVMKDLKLKYRGSVIGFMWSLANPLLMTIVYTFAFRTIMRQGSEGFVFYLLLGLLAWTFFASSAAMSTGAIADSGGLVKSVWFPRAILPVATVLFNLAQYLLTVAAFLPFMLIYFHVPLVAPMLLFPVFVALQTIFTIGVAMILSTSAAFFRDVRHLVDIGIAVLFWTTPILYELGKAPTGMRRLMLFSPASPFISAYHDIFYYRRWPDGMVWAVACTYAVGALAIGLWLMVRYEDSFAERI
jgi:homopolymeric O-antigen transport system permease protein